MKNVLRAIAMITMAVTCSTVLAMSTACSTVPTKSVNVADPTQGKGGFIDADGGH